jgi:hypothetical protein
MPQDDSPPTSKDAPSTPDGWSVEKWWAEMTKPSRQRNLTPSERQSLAITLRLLRRADDWKRGGRALCQIPRPWPGGAELLAASARRRRLAPADTHT